MRKIFVLLLGLLVAIPAVLAGGNSPERRASISSPDKPLIDNFGGYIFSRSEFYIF